MKTLAVVAIMFLPGSFVAAIFSTPMFNNWAGGTNTNSNGGGGGGGSSSVLNRPFAIYWAVTVPLTLFTFGCYVAWLKLHRWSAGRSYDGAASVFDRSLMIAECRKLTWKREAMATIER